MARCPDCKELMPISVALKNILRNRYDRRAQIFTCPGCRKDLKLSIGAQVLSVIFIVSGGTITSVWMLMSPWVSRQPWFGPVAVGTIIILGFSISYYLWWRFVAKMRNV